MPVSTPQDFGYQDPNEWRLRTTRGIKYKFLGMEGNFEHKTGSVTMSVLIQSTDLYAFLSEYLPPPQRIGNQLIPQYKRLTGQLPRFVARSVSARSHTDGVPVDPFGIDPDPPARTYFPVLELDVTFEPRDESDPDNPASFLELSANASGEYIHVSSEGTYWEPDSTGGSNEVNRNPQIPSTILVPETEWTITWPSIPYDLFKSIVLPRVKSIMGKVNSLQVDWVYDAPAETLLFVGYSFRQQYTWKVPEEEDEDPEIISSLIDLDMKILEKRIEDTGGPSNIVGHNHFWKPGEGWRKLLIGARNAYRTTDFNILFEPLEDD